MAHFRLWSVIRHDTIHIVEHAAGDLMVLGSFSLDGKVALVTGASRGLGAAIAMALAQAGAEVICHGNSQHPDLVCATITKKGGKAHAITGDLNDTAVPQRIFREALEQSGRLDILVNNAGTVRRAEATEYSADDWATVINVNLSSVFQLSQFAGRHMISRGGGKILNIASVLSFQGGNSQDFPAAGLRWNLSFRDGEKSLESNCTERCD